jgi:solute carrier family 25 iron transporter 28/37
MMSVPFTAVQFTVYEHFKKILNPTREYSPVTHMIAGGVAGGVAAGVTTPLDVAKTLLQTRGTSKDPEIRRVGGMVDAIRIIWKRDGFKGFGRGISPRVLTHMPSNALCWLSYEFFSEYILTWFISTAHSYLGITIYRGCYLRDFAYPIDSKAPSHRPHFSTLA